MSELRDLDDDGLCDACTAGTSATVNQAEFVGTGPYRRVRTSPNTGATGIRAKIRVPGLLDGVKAAAQPIPSMAVLGEGRPFVYFSALTPSGKAIDIGIQIGFDGPNKTALKAFSLPENDWTWLSGIPPFIVGPSVVFMEFEIIDGFSHFKLWANGFGVGEPLWEGKSNAGVWKGPWKRFAFVTSIGVPKDSLRPYSAGTEAWVCGVDWEVRELKIQGNWTTLKADHVNSRGAYPQPGSKLNSAGKKWTKGESPVYVGSVVDAPVGANSESVTIDIRRP